jgi:hypothetical protein
VSRYTYVAKNPRTGEPTLVFDGKEIHRPEDVITYIKELEQRENDSAIYALGFAHAYVSEGTGIDMAALLAAWESKLAQQPEGKGDGFK